jgi:ribosome-binding factor A
LRSVPQLHFIYDESVERGVHLSQLIDRANDSGSPS